jgi:hypothetical protein
VAAPSRLKGRSGKVRPMILVWLIVLGALGYCAFEFGGVYWRKYTLEETVTRDLSSAGQIADETIRQTVLGHIAAMHLPSNKRSVRFARTDAPRALRVSVSYVETVNLFFTKKDIPISVEFARPF